MIPIFPGHISHQEQSDKQLRGLDKILNPLNYEMFGAEGRIRTRPNDFSKLLISLGLNYAYRCKS